MNQHRVIQKVLDLLKHQLHSEAVIAIESIQEFLFRHLVGFLNRLNADVLNVVVILFYQFYFILFLQLIDCDERIVNSLLSNIKCPYSQCQQLNDENPFSCSSRCLIKRHFSITNNPELNRILCINDSHWLLVLFVVYDIIVFIWNFIPYFLSKAVTNEKFRDLTLVREALKIKFSFTFYLIS